MGERRGFNGYRTGELFRLYPGGLDLLGHRGAASAVPEILFGEIDAELREAADIGVGFLFAGGEVAAKDVDESSSGRIDQRLPGNGTIELIR